MKRVIVRYEKLTKEIMDMLIKKYPNGYDYSHIITFKNKEGTSIKAVEVSTDDTIYLVKVSEKLEQTMEDYMEDYMEEEQDFVEDIFNADGVII